MIQMAGKTKQNGIQLPLEPLLAMLRRRGFIIKPDDYLEVLQLVRQFGSQNIDETAEWLCPVLATGPQEQALFYTILEEYKNQQSHTAEIKQPKRSWLRRYWWVHVLVLAALALLFAIPNPKPGLRAKIAPLKSLYEIGDTLILDASEVFLGMDEDTARTNVFWRINNELPVQGYRYRYVIKKAGPIRIIQSLRLGNVDTLNMRDTTYTYACSYIPEISIKTDLPTIRKGSMLHVTSVYSKDENKDARLKWQITGTVDSIIYDTEELFIKTDSAGDLQINCTLIPSADSACANTSVLKVKIIEDTEQFKSEMRMAGTKWESPKPKMKTLLHWLILLPSIAGILLLDFLKRRRKKKPELFAKGNEESIAALKPVYEVPFEKRDTLIVSDETGLKRLFNQMRQKTEDDIQQLNVRETIATITKNGGIPDLVFSPRLKQREYLLLIERTNPKSLSTAFFEWFARTMQEANLSVSIVFYDQDFLCYHKDFPLGITLHRCGQLFGHHILIICGSGYNLLDSAYPVWNKQLAEALNQWDFKGLITPIPFPDWALKEKVISEKLVIVPADLNALDILIPFIREKQTGAYSYLKTREKQWSSLEETDFESTIELKQYLGNDEVLYQWLCAACLYPKIRWEILVEAGNIVCNNHACPEKLTYSNL
nr:hypothetical protein [Chitinophagaceae bacterium]